LSCPEVVLGPSPVPFLAQDRESRRRGGGSDPTPPTDIVVCPVPAETPGAPIEVARRGRQVDKRDSIALRSQVPPHRPEHPELGQVILARYAQRERRRQRAADVQAPYRVAKRRADLPLAHPFRNDEEEVRKPAEIVLLGPPRREPEVALELSRQRAERLGAPVVLEVELAGPTRVQIPPEPVRLDLSGFRADPVLGAPGGQAVVLVGSGGFDQGAEERVDAEPVGEVLLPRYPPSGIQGRSEARTPLTSAQAPRRALVRNRQSGGRPSRKPLLGVNEAMSPRSLSSFSRC
jgi:hypothetical protein